MLDFAIPNELTIRSVWRLSYSAREELLQFSDVAPVPPPERIRSTVETTSQSDFADSMSPIALLKTQRHRTRPANATPSLNRNFGAAALSHLNNNVARCISA
jgi:hypothetical protein